MRYVYDKSGKLISSFHNGTNEEIKKQLNNQNIFIVNECLGEQAIVEDKNIRKESKYDLVKTGKVELRDGEYIEGKEVIEVEKPDECNAWDKEKNEWFYSVEVEKSFLKNEIINFEGELSNIYDELEKAVIRKLKMRETQLNQNIEELSGKINEKYKRLEELQGSEG